MKAKRKFVFGINNDIEVEINAQYLKIIRNKEYSKFNLGNKVIDVKTITAYSYKAPRRDDNGLIHIDYVGNLENTKGSVDHFVNENCIIVTDTQYEQAKQFLNCLEGYMEEKYLKEPMAFIADEIVKLHKLYQNKLITKEQLQREKTKLFNK